MSQKELQRELEDVLYRLASNWRETHQASLVTVYEQVMTRMFALGWNGALDLDCELPYELMPKVYFAGSRGWDQVPSEKPKETCEELEDVLHSLASAWRQTHHSSLVHVYEVVIDRLFELDWDGSLDLACMLPSYLMPKRFFQKGD